MEYVIPNIIGDIINSIGVGYKENIYHKCIEVEFKRLNILFMSEVVVPIIYKGISVGHERTDIIIYDEKYIPTFIIELKSQTSKICGKEIIQLSKYMINMNVYTGFIINFINIAGDININNTIDKHLDKKAEVIILKYENNSYSAKKYSFETLEYNSVF